MNYVITGSIGHISKPIVSALVAAGHQVKVITSNSSRTNDISSLGAIPLVGLVEDTSFVDAAFAGADAVYLMIPPKLDIENWFDYQQKVADNYVGSIEKNKVPYVVQLSSIGAHMRKGAGPIDGLGYLEEKLDSLSSAKVAVLRPSFFYYNLFNMIGLIKQAGIMGGNYGGNEKLVLVHTSDIAEVAIQKLLALNFNQFEITYISSAEATSTDIAGVIGTAIGLTSLPWIVFKDEDAYNGMIQAGLPKTIAEGYTQMGKSIREGLIQAHYWESGAKPTGKVTLEQFAAEFAAVFNA